MRLHRNMSTDGSCKYIVINQTKFPKPVMTAEDLIAALQQHPEAIEFGKVGEPDEFFVIKLKDINAEAALLGYATKAIQTDMQYAAEVVQLAGRAGPNSPFCKQPD